MQVNSLCGKCNAQGDVHMHTFSIDGVKFYCVECLHTWVGKNNPKRVIVPHAIIERNLENNDVSWDGISGQFAHSCGQGEHYERIMNADMNYPICINDNYVILDGCHRFAKSKYKLKETLISAYIIPQETLSELFSFTE
jgi:hypothetical protein